MRSYNLLHNILKLVLNAFYMNAFFKLKFPWSKMTTDNKKISEAVEGALAHIKTNAPEEHSKLIADGKLEDAITTAAREAADEEVKLAHEFNRIE